MKKRVICLVESSWEGIRKLTISLANEGVPAVCIIKGGLEKEILEIITKYNEISLKPIKRSIFKAYIFTMFLRDFILQHIACIVMDNKKNYRWVSIMNKALGIKTILLVEKRHDYELFWDGRPQNTNFILNLTKKQK